MQSFGTEQLVLQAVPEQINPPEHTAGVAAAQLPLAQVPRSTKFVPEQLAEPQRAVGYEQLPSVRPAHVPPQVASVPQDWLQQLPSGAQIAPAMQPPAVAVQAWPFLLLHTPDASQVPTQRPSGSSAFVTAAQTWAVEQDLQVGHSELVQHPVLAMHVVVVPVVQACIPEGHE